MNIDELSAQVESSEDPQVIALALNFLSTTDDDGISRLAEALSASKHVSDKDLLDALTANLKHKNIESAIFLAWSKRQSIQ